MKIKNSRDEEIPLSAVAELEALDKAETAEEVLAAMPDVPVCNECDKKASEVTSDGLCVKCIPQLPSETVDDTFIDPCSNSAIAVLATDENLAKAEAQLNRDASSVVVPPRPSLEVETEVHVNMLPRVHAHIGRMRAWDLRKLPAAQAVQVRGSIDDLSAAFARVGDVLTMLAKDGFEAKTTPVTRIAAKLQSGAKVSLREDQRSIFSKVYNDEQLDSLSVVKVTDTHVQLMAEDGSNLGLVKLIHVAVKP